VLLLLIHDFVVEEVCASALEQKSFIHAPGKVYVLKRQLTTPATIRRVVMGYIEIIANGGLILRGWHAEKSSGIIIAWVIGVVDYHNVSPCLAYLWAKFR
jgi:hypothetical protein